MTYDEFVEKFFEEFTPVEQTQKVTPCKIVNAKGETLISRTRKTIYKQKNHAKTALIHNTYWHFRTPNHKYINRMIEEGIISIVPVK